jgi:hypothetical protein
VPSAEGPNTDRYPIPPSGCGRPARAVVLARAGAGEIGAVPEAGWGAAPAAGVAGADPCDRGGPELGARRRWHRPRRRGSRRKGIRGVVGDPAVCAGMAAPASTVGQPPDAVVPSGSRPATRQPSGAFSSMCTSSSGGTPGRAGQFSESSRNRPWRPSAVDRRRRAPRRPGPAPSRRIRRSTSADSGAAGAGRPAVSWPSARRLSPVVGLIPRTAATGATDRAGGSGCEEIGRTVPCGAGSAGSAGAGPRTR